MHIAPRSSVRLPSFFGPFAVAAGLMIVSCFSEPFWQNFYILEASSENVNFKAGAYGVCTVLKNTTGVSGPTGWCTSKSLGYVFNLAVNNSGVTEFVTNTTDDNLLFGLEGVAGTTIVPIISNGPTSGIIVHVIAAALVVLTIVSLATPPSSLGHGSFASLQKSGYVTVTFGIAAMICTLVAFAYEFSVIIPARDRLNAIDGIHANWGNIQWFALPSFLLMGVAMISIYMTAT